MSRKMAFSKIVIATAICAVLQFSSPTYAGLAINGRMRPGENSIEDTDYERLLKPVLDGSGNIVDYVYDSSNHIDPGDILEAVLFFNNINSVPIGLGPNYQLQAYSRIMVDKIYDPDANGIANITFKAGFSGNVAIRLFENTTGVNLIDFDTQTAAQSIAAVQSTPVAATFGFVATTDFWSAQNVPLLINPTTLLLASANAYDFGLTMMSNPGGIAIDAVTGVDAVDPLDPTTAAPDATPTIVNVDVRGHGNILRRDANVDGPPDGWDAQTNTQVVFDSTVPEPSAYLIWAAIIAIAAGVHRVRSRSA